MLETFEGTGDRDSYIHLRWPSAYEINQVEIYQVEWVMPEENFMELSEYNKRNPTAPATSDMVVPGPNGAKMVKQDGGVTWKRIKKIIQQAVKSRTILEKDDELVRRQY